MASIVTLATTVAAQAATIGFVSNPTTNSTDWEATVAGFGGLVNSNLDFEGMATGQALDGAFYSASDGVVLSGVGLGNVTYGAGPGQFGTSFGSSSTGEGTNPASNYVINPNGFSSLTLTFAQNVIGAGLFIIDYFNPIGRNGMTIEAFDEFGGSLGSFSAASYSFQRNYRYFMGIASDVPEIRSVVFTDLDGYAGDTTGIDDIRFATVDRSTPPAPVPVPAALPLLATGLAGFAALRRRKQTNKT